MPDRVVIGMSGGVDSSVVAGMLKAKGLDVVGLTMQLSSCESRCCSERDVIDARRVARALGIPHYVISFQESFRKNVIDYFIAEYKRGRTPNPCAMCNPAIKFGVLLDKALGMGARWIATGHYAGIHRDDKTGRFILKRAAEHGKDQSYFLGRLTQHQLSHALFPVASFPKEKIRALAGKMNLPVAQKTDSQEVCFVPDTGVADYLEAENNGPFPKGPILNSAGDVLGEHNGITGYTIGQRKGLGIAVGKPIYVTGIDAETNTVIVGDDHELYKSALIATDPNWIAIPELKEPMEVRTRIRHKHRPALSTIRITENGRVRADFGKPQRGITPGQLAVFYRHEDVIGSAWIDQVL